MTRLPHEQYVRFNITKKISLKEVNDLLYEMRMPDIEADYWKSQAAIISKAALPKQVTDYWATKKKQPKGFLEYMASISLRDAWEDTDLFKKSLALFEDTAVRMTINALIILKTPLPEIDAALRRKFATPTPIEIFPVYQLYFFNPAVMDRKSWNAYVKNLVPKEKDVIYKALSGDEVACYTALGLPVKVSVSDHYQKLHLTAMAKYQELSTMRDPKSDAQALRWASLAMAAGDKYEKLKTADVMDFSKELELSFEHVETDFPMIGEDIVKDLKKES